MMQFHFRNSPPVYICPKEFQLLQIQNFKFNRKYNNIFSLQYCLFRYWYLDRMDQMINTSRLTILHHLSTQLDYSLWVIIKNVVYASTSQNWKELCQRIQPACQEISPQITRRVVLNKLRPVETYTYSSGRRS